MPSVRAERSPTLVILAALHTDLLGVALRPLRVTRACTVQAKSGFYADPVATLDFASLYPSIMQAHNLCYTTLVREQDIPSLEPDEYVVDMLLVRHIILLCPSSAANCNLRKRGRRTYFLVIRVCFRFVRAPCSYERSPTGNMFVKASVRRGILPTILDELLAARTRAKADMKARR